MKKLLAVFIVIIMISASACGGAQSAASASEPGASSAPASSVPEPVPESSEPSQPQFVPPENYNDVAQTAGECDAIRAGVEYTLLRDAYFENEYWDLFALGAESYPVREFLNRAGFYHDAFASPAGIDQNTLLGCMLMACRPCAVGEDCFGDSGYNYSDALFPILNSLIADPSNEFVTKSGCSMYLREQVEDAARYFFGDTTAVAHQTVENSPAWLDWDYREKEGVYLLAPTGGYGCIAVLRSLTDNGDGTLAAEVIYIGASYDTYYDPDSVAQGAMPNFRTVVTEGNTERYERDTDGMRQYLDTRSVRHTITLKVLPDGGYNILSQALEYPEN